MKKKKVFLSAYICANLGDDLFIKIICERYKNVLFYIHGSKEYKHIFSDIKNLKYISIDTLYYRIIGKICNIFKINIPSFLYYPKTNALVKIGGSLFIESKNWKINYQNNMELNSNYKEKFLLGANFGPYHSEEFFHTYKEYFISFNDICFRESYSKNLFSSLQNVRQAADIVFQLQKKQSTEKNYYIISLINCKERESLKSYHDAYINKVAKLTKEIIKNGFEVVFLSFCEAEKDTEAFQEIFSKMETKDKEKIQVHIHNNIDTSLELIASSKGIVATRFHAMILGFLFQKPTIPIIYSKKMLNILHDMKYENIYYDLQNIHELDVNTCLTSLLQKSSFDIAPMVKSSQEQFKKLDVFLQN